ncbi:carbohydrate-binding module family 43 protein [Apiospora marii]|uniref:1,3-beta-glucanosyltransferase n=1 Tax=Apiospora marii TaxID=335849 RepID=A0ABR1RLS2_9PEZI
MVSSFLTGAGLAALAFATGSAAVDPIVAKGKYFFFNNGTQFYIRGVAYQQGVGVGGSVADGQTTFTDPLADAKSCTRDVPMLQQLGTNTIRVYAVDPTKDHKECMTALADAGIYVIADLSEPGVSIERDNPQWNTALMARYTSVIDALAPFNNTLGFFAGNEVTNNNTNTAASAFVKAAVRDSKAYIAGKKDIGRWLGVGYATNDDSKTRDELASYFNCGADPKAAVDFWGYNIYEWCGKSTFRESGYEERTQAFRDYSVPAFFSEYGCNNPGGGEARPWQETSVLYSDLMNKVWSGGIVYEYFQEQNDFGLVNVDKAGKVTPRKDFAPLAKQIADFGHVASNKTMKMAAYKPAEKARQCPPVAKGSWEAAEALPPTPDKTVCECMVSSLSCVAADNMQAKDMGSLFGTVCGLDPKACAGITADAKTGTYGAFAMCDSKQQLAHVLDAYYKGTGKSKAAACDFKGQAKLVNGGAPPTVASSCQPALASASASPVTKAGAAVDPSTVGGSDSGSGSSSGGSGSSSGGGSSGSGSSGSGSSGSGSGSSSGGASSSGSGSSTPAQGAKAGSSSTPDPSTALGSRTSSSAWGYVAAIGAFTAGVMML